MEQNSMDWKFEELKIPAHVAIILDGNGRYAAAHGLPRKLGHKAGCDNLETLVEDAANMGIKYLTVYGFSTENWKRSDEEVGALMALFRIYLKRLRRVAAENNVKVVSIGDISRFSEDIVEAMREMEAATAGNTRMTFVIAINYGGRDEIVRAVRQMTEDAAAGRLVPSSVDEAYITSRLDTRGIPEPDLLIRTGGEKRISNFLLWELAYTEFYFCETYWPDFHKEELTEAIEEYNRRSRRFGGR